MNRYPLPVLQDGASQATRGLDAPEAEGEFSPHAAVPPEGFERREFLRIAAASLAAAGLAGCWKTPEERIIAYGNRPPELTPGNALHYATAWTLDGHAMGLLVTAREGRPIKIEGNPDHPSSRGATSAIDQAALLQLYDDNRAKRFRLRRATSEFKTVLQTLHVLARAHESDRGARLRFLLEPGASPLLTHLRERIQGRFPRTRIDAWSPISEEAAFAGAELAFGRPLAAAPELKLAKVVVSIDHDFLGSLPGCVRLARDFAERREPGPEMNRLYVAEATLTVTGGFADHRLRMKPSSLPELALALAAEVAHETGQAALAAAVRPSRGLDEYQRKWVRAAAKDLAKNRGQAVVLVGRGQPAWVHALAHGINEALGAHGQTVRLFEPATDDVRSGPTVLKRLADEAAAGELGTLVVTAHNPVFTAPADIDFGAALDRIPETIYWAHFEEETSRRCASVLPAAHFLESWGDARAFDGTASIIQPLIQPLFGGVTEADVLSPFAGLAGPSTHDLLKSFWQERAHGHGDFQPTWEDWLAKGLVPDTARTPEKATPRFDAIAAAVKSAPPPREGALELQFLPDAKVLDGRFAMNAWLQELPDPVTKNSWDNALLVSPATAGALGIYRGQAVELTHRGAKLTAVTYQLPGQPDGVLTLSLGYGGITSEHDEGQVAGVNAYRLRHSDAPWSDAEPKVRPLQSWPMVANTQHHGTMEGREIALEKTADDFHAHPDALVDKAKVPEHLYFQDPEIPGQYQWAMTVDLNRCTGCSACVIACQAENNIPCVGKAAVNNGREMHWLRIDRYFTGALDDPGMITQPMLCQHCEAAPCEYVCPVNATVHSDEGLNEMVYNRCVGTRYCSNNCPYKVRRFNFVDYHRQMPEVTQMLQNPDVTVRARGVMEKCSYCVQRIERARIRTRIEGREIHDGEVVTACAQACPTQAITFGTLTDAKAKVVELRASKRRYDVLSDLGTRPRTGYLLRIKNPNPELG